MSTYESFIENKITISDKSGFTVAPEQLHPSTFPHQRDAIQWAAAGGRRLIAMNFGLGKTHVATELNPEYWTSGVDYLKKLEQELSVPMLFDFLQHTGELQPVEDAQCPASVRCVQEGV